MAPSIAIALDAVEGADPKWKDYFVAGSVLSGEVRISCSEPVDCQAVRCVIGWHTEGRGDRDEGTAWSKTLHTGPLNGQHTFPFEAVLPIDGPISYSGHYVNIVWTVTSVIELAWKKDPQAEVRFFVLPAPYLETSQ